MSYVTASERQTLLTSELSGARSQGMLVQSLEHIAEAFGFTHFVLFNAPAKGDTLLSPLVIETSMPAHFLKDFDRNQFLSICRMLAPPRETILPVTGHFCDLHSSDDKNVSAKLRAFVTEREIPTVFVFAVSAIEGQRFVFWFCGNRNNLAQIEINELSMLVLQALSSYYAIKRNSSALLSTLSAREVEVIRWTSQGKTSVEIAQILALSDHTVNAYMTNAIRKLDCVNRTQLVAKAIRMKLIN